MKRTIKKLKIKGLFVVSLQSSSFRWCKLMSEKNDAPIRNYTSKPIEKITDFIKLFEESLSHLDWSDELTDKHREAIMKMECRIETNQFGKLAVKTNKPTIFK